MSVFDRPCPSCGARSISVFKLPFWRVRCANCNADVGTSPAWRLPILSFELMVWLLALNWLYRDYGRSGLIASFVVWLLVDLVADWYTPLVARKR